MKIKLGKLYASKNALKKIFKFNLPSTVLYEHKKDFKKISEELDILDSIQNDLIRKHGIKVNAIDFGIPNPTEENSKKYEIPLQDLKDKFDQYLNEFNETLERDIDLDVRSMNRDDIKSANNKFSFDDDNAVDWFLKG